MIRRHTSGAKRPVFGLLALATLIASPDRTAYADGGQPARAGHVVLQIDGCPDAATEAVRRIVGIEIGDLLVDAGQPGPGDSAHLTVRCSGEIGSVEATGDSRSKPLERTLDLAAFPGDAAPRALALAGLETLAASSPEVRQHMQARQNSTRQEASPNQTAQPSAAPHLPSEPVQEEPDRPGFRIGVGPSWRTFLVAHGPSVWGGKLDLDRDLGRRWYLRFDIDASGTSRAVSLADHHGSLGDASALLFSVGGFFGPRWDGRRSSVALTLGGRMGLARMAGTAAPSQNVAADHVVRAWGGPAVTASLHGEVGRVGLTLAAEAGRSLIAAAGLADNTTVLAIDGTWVAVALGVAYRTGGPR